MAKLKEGPLGPLFGMLEVGMRSNVANPFWLSALARAVPQMCFHACWKAC